MSEKRQGPVDHAVDPSTAEAYRIAAMDDGVMRERAVQDFHRTHDRLYVNIARQFKERTGVAPSDLDDLTQVVRIEANDMITNGRMRSGYPFGSNLRQNLRSKLRDWSYSSQRTGLTGASGAMRRHVDAGKSGGLLEQRLGRPPTTKEIVEAARDEMKHRRSNPTKGGLIAEVDVTGVRVTPYERVDDVVGGYLGPGVFGSSSLSAVEIRPFIRRLIARADEAPAPFGELARVYFAQFVEDEISDADLTDIATVAKHLGRTRKWVREHINELHALAREILAEDFGIEGPNAVG